MHRPQNERSAPPEADASDAEQAAAKQAALEARTAAGEALTELQLVTDDPRILELAAHVVDFTYSLHETPTGPTATCAPLSPGRTQCLKAVGSRSPKGARSRTDG
ncbi:hypothetical protein ACFV2U_47330 [Streptomyces sp. NPDC059697]|uniref:hypothetical protein n=1 Tax=Streptomyces sp. NPDC059697 TaxID=3346912 RepID=UPI0036771CE3